MVGYSSVYFCGKLASRDLYSYLKYWRCVHINVIEPSTFNVTQYVAAVGMSKFLQVGVCATLSRRLHLL